MRCVPRKLGVLSPQAAELHLASRVDDWGSLKPYTRKPDTPNQLFGNFEPLPAKIPSPGCSKASWIIPDSLIQHEIVGQLGVVINVHDVPLLGLEFRV